jgi:hypothetical protein
LLARLIFIQFLFQRKDSKGNPALSATVLNDLYQKGILSKRYATLPEILLHKGNTYALFEWLNERFNGDLFPDDWRQERSRVKTSHLQMLSKFVSGDLVLREGQRCLWPFYSFDAIPLEFVSSIYEEFVRSDDDRGVGEHYTPPHIVDFLLDRILPCGGTEYDVRILDPACGSAVFLVKAFQRLVNRWRNANPGKEPAASFLRSLLENNLHGVDTNPRAIRVASFSLYLAMCDEIDPRHYWRQVRFPRLRDVTLRQADFFREDVAGICCDTDAASFDLVVGNAPWGDASLSDPGRKWADQRKWPTADEQIGPLFLPKAAELVAPDGIISMIQPASSLLFNRSNTAIDARKRLFSQFKVEEVVNFSTLRFHLFPAAVGPPCIITMRTTAPDAEPIAYWSPKQSYSVGSEYRVIVDAHDLNWISPREAALDPVVWSALTWGGRRDLELVRRLQRHDTLANPPKNSQWKTARGFQRGVRLPSFVARMETPRAWCNVRHVFDIARVSRILRECLDQHPRASRVGVVCYRKHQSSVNDLPSTYNKRISDIIFIEEATSEVTVTGLEDLDLFVILAPVREYPDRLGIPCLENERLWNQCTGIVHASDFPPNSDAVFEHERDMSSFRLPAILVKETWTVDRFRFKCVVVAPDSNSDALLFKQSFYSIRGPGADAIASLALTLQSSLAVHFFYLTSGRLASYRPTLRQSDLTQIPLPAATSVTVEELASMTEAQVDDRAFELFGLAEAERVLVDDFFQITLPDFKGDASTPGRQPFTNARTETPLHDYCNWFMRVLKSGFGPDKAIRATIYASQDLGEFPYCLVAFHLDWPERPELVEVVDMKATDLRQMLGELDRLMVAQEQGSGGIFHRRIGRSYTSGFRDVTRPTVFLVKPNERRYWSRSLAMRDADEVAADILQWNLVTGR